MNIPYSHSGQTASATRVAKLLAKTLLDGDGILMRPPMASVVASPDYPFDSTAAAVIKPPNDRSSLSVVILPDDKPRPPAPHTWPAGTQLIREPYFPRR